MEISSVDPKTGGFLPGNFTVSTEEDLNGAIHAAKSDFEVIKKISGAQRAEFLEAIAQEIEALGDELIERACAESALPAARITGERGRTMGQLRLFASLLKEGSWVEASIDTAIPDRAPLPKPDVRKMLRPIGPVAIFTASNFPLAFSTAGGDTTSALAAGNPVIVKAHNAHLGTDQLVSGAIKKAAARTGMPSSIFQSVIGNDFSLGQQLVQHPDIKAVGFTGSFNGGKALFDLACNRIEPIPVFAEMGSVNPTIVLPGALSENGSEWAAKIAGSVTLGVGQFCTNPGVILGLGGNGLDEFTEKLGESIKSSPIATMLHSGIASNFKDMSSQVLDAQGVQTISESEDPGSENSGRPMAAKTTAKDFMSNDTLSQEVFGPFTLVVSNENKTELHRLIAGLEGQLTITFIANENDIAEFEDMIHLAEEKAGRVIFNSVPTGVEVCHSMVHGGPFPATTNSNSTSVGTDAIKRFTRPVCFQDAPESILPDELKDGNPLGIFRKKNGEFSK